MRSILLGCFFLMFIPIAWGNEEVKAFTKNLCDKDRIILDKFFRSMAKSTNGFVIYGDKPMALKSYLNNTVYLPYGHESILANGKDLWLNLNVSPSNKEYLLAIFNAAGYCNFVAINRKAFIQAVNENLSLFRYVLGPTLTAEALLQELIDAKDDFYNVLKDDTALQGILFGYGTQNALLVSRSESVCCSHVNDQKEEFPLLPYKIRMERTSEPKNQTKHPSFGFHSIFEEIEALNHRISSSHEDSLRDPYVLPFFGCELDSEVTQSLLATYKKNQAELLKVVQEPDFLEKTLAKFFTTTSGTIEIPSIPTKNEPLFVESREDVSDKLADLLAIDVQYTENRSRELCCKSYLQGFEAQELYGQDPKEMIFNPYWEETYNLNEDLNRSEKLKKANDYFNRLSQSEKYTCLIPNGIYYRVLRKGQGEPASSKMKKASFHYSYKILGEKKPYSFGTIIDENPEHFIPGLIHTLIGMKRGEERFVCIHPKYGYGDHSLYEPNLTFLVKVQLLEFEEGDREITILPPYELVMKNIEEMQARFEELKVKEYYEKGRALWHAIKKTGDFIDLQVVKKSMEEILTTDRKSIFKSVKEAHQYSIDLQHFLLSQKNNKPAQSSKILTSSH